MTAMQELSVAVKMPERTPPKMMAIKQQAGNGDGQQM